MFDIGLGEFIALAVVALIVFGPDRLPKAAAQGGRALRQLREMAANARKELGDSAGLDTITEELKSLQELHPKRIISSALEGPAEPAPAAGAKPNPPPSSAPSTNSSPHTNASVGTQGSSSAQPANPASQATPQGSAPPPPAASPGGYDPDAT